MSTLVIGAIATLGAANRLIPRGGVLVEGGRIAAVGEAEELRRSQPAAEVVDVGSRLVLPGLICAHTHFYGCFARGLAVPGEPPKNFSEILERLWWRLDKLLTLDDTRASARVFLIDAIRNGCTTMIDHHASPNAVEGALETIADCCLQAGARACLAYEVSDRDGPQVAEASIEGNAAFIRGLRGKAAAEHGLLAGSFGLHASFTLSRATLGQAVARGRDLGVGFHIHVAEDRSDEEDALASYGRRTVHRLAEAGVLGPETIAAHCVHVDADEIRTLADSATKVVHNPRSNMNNAVGVAPVETMLDRRVTVGLGNDGFSMDMFQEMKAAYLLHKSASGDPRRMAGDRVLAMAFAENARIAEAVFGPFLAPGDRLAIGELAPGARADLAVLDYDPPTPLAAGNLPWHAIFGMHGAQVRWTMVEGRWLLRDGVLQTLDEVAIHAEARELSAKLWKRLTEEERS